MIFNMNYEQYYNPPYENLITKSINADGSVCGLIDGHRYNSSDTLVEGSTYQCSGFMPYMQGEVLHFKNISFGDENNGAAYLRFYEDINSSPIEGITANWLQAIEYANTGLNAMQHYLTYDKNNNLKTITSYSSTQASHTLRNVKWCRISWIKRPDMKGEPMIWKTPQEWDLDKRRQITFSGGYKLDNTGVSILDQLNTTGYMNRIQSTGIYTATTQITVSNITENGFTLSTTYGSYGIGIPYYLKAGQTLSLTATVTGDSSIYINGIWFDLEGKWMSSSTSSSIKNITKTQSWTADTDKYLVLIFAPYTINVEVTVSNIQLEIM